VELAVGLYRFSGGGDVTGGVSGEAVPVAGASFVESVASLVTAVAGRFCPVRVSACSTCMRSSGAGCSRSMRSVGGVSPWSAAEGCIGLPLVSEPLLSVCMASVLAVVGLGGVVVLLVESGVEWRMAEVAAPLMSPPSEDGGELGDPRGTLDCG